MNLSEVPTDVLERIKGKWEKILSWDNIHNEPCAMCEYTGSGRPGFSGYCGCPIEDECGGLLKNSKDWMSKRNRFLDDIKSEIKNRGDKKE